MLLRNWGKDCICRGEAGEGKKKRREEEGMCEEVKSLAETGEGIEKERNSKRD